MDMQANWFVQNQKPRGDFYYGRYLEDGSELEGNNVVRQAGSLYSLAQYYKMSHRPDLKETLLKGFDYFSSHAKGEYGKEGQMIAIGDATRSNTSALFLLSLIEYTEAEQVSDAKMLSLMHDLAKYLVSTQQEDGKYIYIYPSEESAYNDGETMYALIRMYALTKEPLYLESVKRAFPYMEKKYKDADINTSFFSWGIQAFYYLYQAQPEEKYWEFIRDYSKKFMESQYYQIPQQYYAHTSDKAPSWNVNVYMEGLAHTAKLAETKDSELYKELAPFLRESVIYLMKLQFNHPLSSRRMKDKNLIGSICAYQNCTECTYTRIDTVHHTLSAMFWYLALLHK
jgi:hypothetical protein